MIEVSEWILDSRQIFLEVCRKAHRFWPGGLGNTKVCRSALSERQSTLEGFDSDLHADGLTPNLYRRKHKDAETISKMPCVFLSTGTTGLAVNIRRVYEVDVAPYQRSLGKGELGFVNRADM